MLVIMVDKFGDDDVINVTRLNTMQKKHRVLDHHHHRTTLC